MSENHRTVRTVGYRMARRRRPMALLALLVDLMREKLASPADRELIVVAALAVAVCSSTLEPDRRSGHLTQSVESDVGEGPSLVSLNGESGFGDLGSQCAGGLVECPRWGVLSDRSRLRTELERCELRGAPCPPGGQGIVLLAAAY